MSASKGDVFFGLVPLKGSIGALTVYPNKPDVVGDDVRLVKLTIEDPDVRVQKSTLAEGPSEMGTRGRGRSQG